MVPLSGVVFEVIQPCLSGSLETPVAAPNESFMPLSVSSFTGAEGQLCCSAVLDVSTASNVRYRCRVTSAESRLLLIEPEPGIDRANQESTNAWAAC